MASTKQLQAREVNFAIYRVMGARQLFKNLYNTYKLSECKEAEVICNLLLKKIRGCR